MTSAGSTSLAVKALGVLIQVQLDDADATMLAAVRAILPPGWESASADPTAPVFGLSARGHDHEVTRDGVLLGPAGSLGQAVGLLDAQLRLHLATSAPDHVMVHAGAVAWRGRGIVLPGRSFAGKSMLVAALLRAGATYYSDEYAVLSADGRLHPYPRPISLRGTESVRELTAAEFGAATGEQPVPVALIVLAHYEPGAIWAPREATRAQGLIGLMVNTPIARDRPDATMSTLHEAAAQARVLKGVRGDAQAAAPELLRAVAVR